MAEEMAAEWPAMMEEMAGMQRGMQPADEPGDARLLADARARLARPRQHEGGSLHEAGAGVVVDKGVGARRAARAARRRLVLLESRGQRAQREPAVSRELLRQRGWDLGVPQGFVACQRTVCADRPPLATLHDVIGRVARQRAVRAPFHARAVPRSTPRVRARAGMWSPACGSRRGGRRS